MCMEFISEFRVSFLQEPIFSVHLKGCFELRAANHHKHNSTA